MSIFFFIGLFIVSCIVLLYSSTLLVDALEKIALYLRIREFIIALFLFAIGASIPNLMVGVISAVRALATGNQILTTLSLGDVMGGNILDLSLGLGLAILFSNNGIEANSKTVQFSAIAAIFFATLPLLLMLDGSISRIDGVILIFGYIFYALWVFSDKSRITRPYSKSERKPSGKVFAKSFSKAIMGIFLLMLGGYGIVESAIQFSSHFGLSIGIIGLIVVALANAAPEIFFAIQAAKRGQEWMVLGDLLGGIITCSTLVLGIVAIISPIIVEAISFSVISRVFLILICLFFIVSVRNDRRLSKKEGGLLIVLYVLFLISEMVFRDYINLYL